MKSLFFGLISVCVALILFQAAKGQTADQVPSVSDNPTMREGSSSSETNALPKEDKTVSMARAMTQRWRRRVTIAIISNMTDAFTRTRSTLAAAIPSRTLLPRLR